MSESTAAPQQVNTLEEIETAMVEMEEGFIRLYQRYVELNGKGVEDKRKTFNPHRDLKISANRSYGWARRAGCDADMARDRAIAATIERAKEQEKEHILGKLLLRLSKKLSTPATSDGTLPAPVMSYIDLLYSEYNLTTAEKKAAKKPTTRKKKEKKVKASTSI